MNSLQTVLKKAGLDKIHVIPNAQNPLKLQVEGPSADQRLEMVRRALSSYGEEFVVDDIEIRRGGKSYTIDTVRDFQKKFPKDELFLIIGADNFENLDQWKDAGELVKEVNLIVTTRPGYEVPEEVEELPQCVRSQLEEKDFNFIELKSGRSVQFLSLKDMDLSSSQIRKKLRGGKPVQADLPLGVETYIKEKGLYRPLGDRIQDFKKFTEFCAQALYAKKGISLKAFDLTKTSTSTEYALIASGTSTRHAAALAESVISAAKEEYGVSPQGIEGFGEGRWVVLDYGSLIVHVFYDFVRNEYALENLWKDGVPMEIEDLQGRRDVAP